MTCLDDLIHQHERYLHRVLFRCLLNSKAAPVMKIITDIFGTITRFSSLAGQGGEAWEELEKLYRSFSVYSRCFSLPGRQISFVPCLMFYLKIHVVKNATQVLVFSGG